MTRLFLSSFFYNDRYQYRNPTLRGQMALLKKLVKITDYTGLYFQDENDAFSNQGEVSITEIQKKTKPPYTLFSRFYEGKKSVYLSCPIINNTKTIKRICDELSAQRKIQQIEKTFKPKEISKTINQIFDEWIEYRKSIISPKHYQVTKYCFNAEIRTVIGDLKANSVTTKKIQYIINTILDNGKAPRTAKTIKDILSPIFEYGIKNNYCECNPAKDAEIPKFDNQIYFTIESENAKKLYDIIVNYPIPVIRGIFIFLLHGRRKNEVLKLRWENIDFSQKLYSLKGSQNKSKKNLTFPLSDLQIGVLEELEVRKSGYIFLKDDGNPYQDTRYHWEKIKSALGIEIRLHDLRHLIGFIAVNEGVPLAAISKTLGHSNMQITERYSNVRIEAVNQTLSKVFNVVDKGLKPIDDKLKKLKNLFPDKTDAELLSVINILQ